MSNIQLIALDLETTGLTPDDHVILEIGMVALATPSLEEVGRYHAVIRADEDDLLLMSTKVEKMHTDSGLLAAVRGPAAVGFIKAINGALQFVREHCPDPGEAGPVMLGANPGFDRSFLEVYAPALFNAFHYRNVDTNSWYVLDQLTQGGAGNLTKPGTVHRAIDDCLDSVALAQAQYADAMTITPHADGLIEISYDVGPDEDEDSEV